MPTSSSRTATLRIPTAPTAATRLCTRVTAPSTARLRLSLLTASLLEEVEWLERLRLCILTFLVNIKI